MTATTPDYISVKIQSTGGCVAISYHAFSPKGASDAVS